MSDTTRIHPFTREWWSEARHGARYGWLYGWMVGGAMALTALVIAGVYLGAAALLVGGLVGYGLGRIRMDEDEVEAETEEMFERLDAVIDRLPADPEGVTVYVEPGELAVLREHKAEARSVYVPVNTYRQRPDDLVPMRLVPVSEAEPVAWVVEWVHPETGVAYPCSLHFVESAAKDQVAKARAMEEPVRHRPLYTHNKAGHGNACDTDKAGIVQKDGTVPEGPVARTDSAIERKRRLARRSLLSGDAIIGRAAPEGGACNCGTVGCPDCHGGTHDMGES